MIQHNRFIEGLISKDEKIILEIYEIVFPRVLKFVKTNSGNRSDAEDVFQKALMQIMARLQIKRFEITSAFESYLFVACKNLWRKELIKRKKELTNQALLEPLDEHRSLAISALEQERWDFFQEMILKLSDNCKLILGKFFNKIPYKQIALELDYADESVVRQRVFKCKKKLTELIQDDSRFNELKNL